MLRFVISVQTRLAGRLERDDRGASLVEYSLLVALIAVFCIAAITTLGGAISGFFGEVSGTITGVDGAKGTTTTTTP